MALIVRFDELATPQKVIRVIQDGNTELFGSQVAGTFVPDSGVVVNPDLSLLDGIVPRRYWKHVGGAIVEYTQGEKDAQDAAEAAANDLSIRESAKSDLTGFQSLGLLLRGILDLIRTEFNILRAANNYGGLWGASGTGQVVSAGSTEVLADMAGSNAMETVGNITSDNTTGVVTLVDAGTYLVDFGMSFSATQSEWQISVFGQNTEVPQSVIRRDVAGTGLVGDVSRTFIATTPIANVGLTIRISHTEGSSQTLTPQHWTLTATKLNDFTPRTLTQLKNAINGLIDGGTIDDN